MADAPPRPVIVVTGANSGVGLGTCQRLLVQLSAPLPSDTEPRFALRDGPAALPSPFAAPHGCTLVLACRNPVKAHRARRELMALLEALGELPDEAQPTEAPRSRRLPKGSIDEDADPALAAQAVEASIRRRRRRGAAAAAATAEGQAQDALASGATSSALPPPKALDTYDETRDGDGASLSFAAREARARGVYRRRFVAGTRIEFVPLDLGSMASVLSCAKDITERHGYVTHLILNAGTAAWTGINWALATWMIITRLHTAVTWPHYKLQRSGDKGSDGYGWVWQANVGAHYILTRALLPALRATPYATPSRVIWTGSIEAFGRFYKPDDWQCLDPKRSPHPYESSKYQCELAALGLEDALRGPVRLPTAPGTPTGDASPRTAQGIEPTSFTAHPGVVASSIFAEYLNVFMALCMKFAFYLARWTLSPHHPIEAYKGAVAASHVALAPLASLDPTRRYGARADFWGREYVDAGRMDGWAQRRDRQASEQEGEHVRAQARDLIARLEGVAGRVWEEARDGSLPPFRELGPAGDSFSSALLLPSSKRAEPASPADADRDWEKVESEV